jgi:hypothetical protein
MGFWKNLLKSISDYISDADQKKGPEKLTIRELATKRVQDLNNRWKITEGHVTLAMKTRRELQKQVAEAEATKALGMQAMQAGDTAKANACAARYASLQESIRELFGMAQSSDQTAKQALGSFKHEAQAARRAVEESKVLSVLEQVIDLQEEQRKLELESSTGAQMYEEAKDSLLIKASVLAATSALHLGDDAMALEIREGITQAQIQGVANNWQQQLLASGGSVPQIGFEAAAGDVTGEATTFLDEAPLGGMLGHGFSNRKSPAKQVLPAETAANKPAEAETPPDKPAADTSKGTGE